MTENNKQTSISITGACFNLLGVEVLLLLSFGIFCFTMYVLNQEMSIFIIMGLVGCQYKR